jgi:hypothetical protein
MYSIIFHAHQKLDRMAYRVFKSQNLPGFFPSLKDILYFDGKNGPDSSKLKKQVSQSQPYHFIDPNNAADVNLIIELEHHYDELVKNLKKKDEIKSAFEASWLAHALVDGLTPAHHFPYAEAVEDIYGAPKDQRKGFAGRAYVKTGNIRNTIKKSYKLAGPKGIVTSHMLFEAGAYVITAPIKFTGFDQLKIDISGLNKDKILKIFKQYLNEIDALDLFGRYQKTGWTKILREDFKNEVVPKMVQIINLAWTAASNESYSR